jgi:adsorption protein B
MPPWLGPLLTLTIAGCLWRAAMRIAFTAREYGLTEGLRAPLRILIGNVIAIMAGRRAIFAYIRTLRGTAVKWDKTAHHFHPVLHRLREVAR